jgi:hypothetical protein
MTQEPTLRYVVLRHEGYGEPHFDLMFETAPGSPLLTWRSGEWPLRTGLELTRLGDHRREYLEYEGPISNNRGHVSRVAAGTFYLSTNGRGMFHGVLDTSLEFLFVHDRPDAWYCVAVRSTKQGAPR